MISRVLTTFLSVPFVALMLLPSVPSVPSVALVWSPLSGAQSPPTKTVEIVSVTGCLREQGTNWMLVAATEPTPSIANQAQAAELPTAPPNGKNTFRLIGTSEFNLPGMKDRTVVIRGLFIKDKVSRINVTSAVEAVASCAPSAPK